MTWRWVIFPEVGAGTHPGACSTRRRHECHRARPAYCLIILAAAFSMAAAAWCATISGEVELKDSKRTGNQRQDAAGVVVWLDPAAGFPTGMPPATASVVHL